MKNIYAKNIKIGDNIKSTFMMMRKFYRDGTKTICLIGDKSGSIKASILDPKNSLNVGDVISINGVMQNILDVNKLKKIDEFSLEEYIPTVETPIEHIMEQLNDLSKEEFKSEESIALNNYFFGNKDFVEKFKKAIGGVSQHHNYIGGLAEHTLNVMYLSKILSHRYDCNHKEIAILSAKLHDIGKIEEYDVNGPFSFTLKGELQGHIVLGITMIEKAFSENENLFTEDFKERIKGCIVQHHGKVEYGSPKKPNSHEAYIVHFADYVDATMNKIDIVKRGVEINNWTEYDRRLETKLYI